MSGVMVGVGVLGAGASIYGANKNSQAAKKASNAQQASSAADLAFRQQQYDRYLGLMGPIEQTLAGEAKSDQPLGYEKMASAIKGNYGDASRGLATAMAGRGMAGSGQDLAGMRGLAMGQANALTGAYSQGLENKRNLGLTLTGRGQIGQAAQGVSGGLQGMANLYGSQANQYNAATQQGWAQAGHGVGNLASMWADREPTGAASINIPQGTPPAPALWSNPPRSQGTPFEQMPQPNQPLPENLEVPYRIYGS